MTSGETKHGLLISLFLIIGMIPIIINAVQLASNAAIIYPILPGHLAFCSHINYTVYYKPTTQSSFNESQTYSIPSIELVTGTVVQLNPDGWHLASTNHSLDTQGRYYDLTVFNESIIDISKVDDNAEEIYNVVLNVLKRYNCRDFYPYNSCNRCLEYYKNWACAITFPMWNSTHPDKNQTVKLCEDVCWEVVRKCPVELDFHCPRHDDTFGEPGQCNSLGLNLTSSASSIQNLFSPSLMDVGWFPSTWHTFLSITTSSIFLIPASVAAWLTFQ